jgi:hypothetical protein
MKNHELKPIKSGLAAKLNFWQLPYIRKLADNHESCKCAWLRVEKGKMRLRNYFLLYPFVLCIFTAQFIFFRDLRAQTTNDFEEIRPILKMVSAIESRGDKNTYSPAHHIVTLIQQFDLLFQTTEPWVISPCSTFSYLFAELYQLHDKNIYVIGRISVFQDPYLTAKYPEWAIQSITSKKPWKDHKGLSFLDPTNTKVWDYIDALAQESYNRGFDEINFDYIRFPSDGNMKDIDYPQGTETRADIIESFFIHLHSKMSTAGIPTSADLFGLTTEAVDDMGIGQVLEKALPNFDFIAPMIYPSHYGKGYSGFTNPADHPYQVITQAMKEGVQRAKILGFDASKFRPWIQDFGLKMTYGSNEVKAQIKATNDVGLTSWILWSPPLNKALRVLLNNTLL